jgi:hypothetical protein
MVDGATQTNIALLWLPLFTNLRAVMRYHAKEDHLPVPFLVEFAAFGP